MSASNPTLSFDEIIQADRKKKQHEALANQMLGSGRKTNAARAGHSIDRRATASPGASLASRVGVQKRSVPTAPKANINGKWNHDLHDTAALRSTAPAASAPPRLPRTASGPSADRGNRLYASLQKDVSSSANNTNAGLSQANIRSGSSGAQMSIRGMAAPGPFVVIASNFAPGTTAADIEAAMAPVGGEIVACRLLSARPTVMSEIVFADRAGAENVVATFNNQKADGRLLYVYMKAGGPSPFPATVQSNNPAPIPTTAPPASLPQDSPLRPRSPAPRAASAEIMDIDDDNDAADPRPATRDNAVRQQQDQNRDEISRQRGGRDQRYDGRGPRAGGYQNGRYGGGGGGGGGGQYERRDDRRGYAPRGREDRGLYSDGMYPRDGAYRR